MLVPSGKTTGPEGSATPLRLMFRWSTWWWTSGGGSHLTVVFNSFRLVFACTSVGHRGAGGGKGSPNSRTVQPGGADVKFELKNATAHSLYLVAELSTVG